MKRSKTITVEVDGASELQAALRAAMKKSEELQVALDRVSRARMKLIVK
jgi:hypothetical protein